MGDLGRLILFRTVASTCGLWCSVAAAQVAAPAPFTQEQADSGRQDYATSCASCHGDHLVGQAGPGLIGAPFNASWAKHTTKELYEYIQTSMPVCNGGSLPNDAYVNIVAFILRENGARPGTEDLSPRTDANIGDIVNGATSSASAGKR
jgi:mono/diheme cytochrome c family protein